MSENETTEKKVLLIGDKKSFMVTAIVNGLKKDQFTVLQADADVTEISHIDPKPGIWVLYLDNNVSDIMEVLIYLRDAIVECRSFLFVIGNPDDLTDVKKVIPENLLAELFTRPLNVQLLSEKLDKALDIEKRMKARKKILIVDDNPTTLHSLQAMLEEKYSVYIANSGMNGIAFMLQTPVDLLLLDYEMPVVDGTQVLEMIRQNETIGQTPVMFLTGKNDVNSIVKAVSLKPEKYLLKTLPPAELIANIDEFFEKSAQE